MSYTPIMLDDQGWIAGLGAKRPTLDPDSLATAQSMAESVPGMVRRYAKFGRRISYPSYWWASYYQSDPSLDHWATTLADESSVGFVIINPNSGPGDDVSEDWQQQVRLAKGAGATVLGYVSTDYANAGIARDGSRDPNTILREIRQYVGWYGIDGIFLDEVSNGWSEAQVDDHIWYQKLVSTVRDNFPELVVVGNPGVNTRVEYAEIFDVLVTFENTAEAYLDSSVSQLRPDHYRTFPDAMFWHMIHDVEGPDQAEAVLEKASRAGVGHLYVTDDSNAHAPDEMWGNPYDVPPAAWLLETQRDWATAARRGPKGDKGDPAEVEIIGTPVTLDSAFAVPSSAPDSREIIQEALDGVVNGARRSYWSILEVNGGTVVLKPGIYRVSAPADGGPSLVVPRGVEFRTDQATLVFDYPATPTTNWCGVLLHSHAGLTVGKFKTRGSAPDAAHVYDAIRSYMQDNRNVVHGIGGAGIISNFRGAGYRGLGSYVVWLQNLRIAFCSHGIVHGHSGGLVTDGQGAYALPAGSTENVSASRRPTDMWVQNVNLDNIKGNNIVVGSPGTVAAPNTVVSGADSVTGGNLHLEHVIAEGSPARFLRARELSEIVFDDVHLEELGAPKGPMIDLDVIFGFIKVSSMRINTSQSRSVTALDGTRTVSTPNRIWQLGSFGQFIHDALYFQNSSSAPIAFSGTESWPAAWSNAKWDIRGIRTDAANIGSLTGPPLLPSDNFNERATNSQTHVMV
ncbi:spherulation-specific family 4 protein [Kocuria sp.]|uniref:spherulation-specific family 4 protein n=1 Tax=Kocuria sp. TaxID=1871328 RepID=UPI0026DFF0F8|nr:spherulation-specific family 4 protein [Kocuria sp.]MDO5619256.1 spherulation-specific family 4 protein [Kocuria sp.]